MASSDKYRSYLNQDDVKNIITWRFGSTPNYDAVNKLFEDGRTKIWPSGSLEDKVQNIVKTWEMEMFHKVNFDDFKQVDPVNYRFSLNKTIINGREKRAWRRLQHLAAFDPAKETIDSSHRAFTTAFPRGFALEILRVYSGPPEIVYKFRHWGFMEGPFKGHSPTGEMVEFFGMAIFEVDENSKVVKVEFFYDRGELLAALIKGENVGDEISGSSCPFLRNTG
ncbi:hypothetical protein CASFOL_016120 [Castilleja foliolosa]|uniref:Pathogen-related protein n=1 Tax=Castilleja foliolosa TaxID=1961234 RepID=A0ABD3DHL1_9LAMI